MIEYFVPDDLQKHHQRRVHGGRLPSTKWEMAGNTGLSSEQHLNLKGRRSPELSIIPLGPLQAWLKEGTPGSSSDVYTDGRYLVSCSALYIFFSGCFSSKYMRIPEDFRVNVIQRTVTRGSLKPWPKREQRQRIGNRFNSYEIHVIHA